MTDCSNKVLKLYKGFPSVWASVDFLSISFDSVISLTNFTMDVKLGATTKHFTNLAQPSIVNYTAQETSALPIGINNMSIIVTDTSNNSRPFTTAIPVMVTQWVQGDQKLDVFEMSVDVKLENTTQFTIKIETAKVSQEWVEELIDEHNKSEQAHQFIQQNLTLESTARASADNTLQANITTEATTRANADASLSTAIDVETTDRQTADSQLQDNITNEGTARQNADETLQDNIDTVNGNLSIHTSDKTNPHEVTKAQVGLGNVANVDTTNASNITTGTLNNNRLNTIPYSKLSGVASSEQGALADTSLQPVDVVNNVTSTGTEVPLSANMGKELQDQINNLKQRGRYLSVWNCATGKATTIPTVNPYTYKSGDYFIVGIVASGSGTNYRPSGATYDKDIASTTVETGDVIPNDTYYYDGTNWTLLHTEQPTVAFGTLAGSPYDNANLTSALNEKVTGNNAVVGATKCKITYDTKGLVTNGSDLVASDIPDLSATYYSASNPSGYQTESQVNTTVTSYHDSTKLDLAGGTMTGALNMNGKHINNANYVYANWYSISANIASNTAGTEFLIKQGSWIYSRTAAQVLSDIGGQASLGYTAENSANKVTSISSSSTDTQYPSAKCVWDIVGNVESLILAL